MSRMLGGPVPNSSKALIALASVTKSFVDDLTAAGGRHVGVCRWTGCSPGRPLAASGMAGCWMMGAGRRMGGGRQGLCRRRIWSCAAGQWELAFVLL